MVTDTQTGVESRSETTTMDPALRYGSSIMAAGFAGLGVFGAVLAVRILGGQGVIESGVDVGSTTAEIAAFNPALPTYIAHIRLAAAGMFIALGILGFAVAWYGVQQGDRWAWTAAVVALVVGTGVGVPMHYSGAFHVDQVRHLGPAFATLALFLVGAVVAYRGLETGTEP